MIAADRRVGRGSCSVIDECYTDAELAEELGKAGCTTVMAAVRRARKQDRLWREREREVCAEIF
jgi:hypothetical protein